MQEKLLLINSMQKLINHIVVSRKNQEEIFASLSKNDFKKIISNLDDDNQRLRKISLALISQLLHNNNALKDKFCHIMNIPLCPGRIALNTKLCAASSRSKNNIAVDMNRNIKEVFTLLKQPVSEHQKQCLFWFINYERSQAPLQLEYLTTNTPQVIEINELLDPIDSMIGFILPERLTSKKTEPIVSATLGEQRRKSEHEGMAANKMVNNYFKPNTVFKPDQIRHYQPNPNLNQSLNLNPGYSTDRQSYVPKPSLVPGRTVNTSMYQEPPSFKPELASPMNHIKPSSFDIENFNRSKYTGIKLISNPNKAKDSGKYFQEQPVYVGSMTSSNGKAISFSSNNSAIGANLGGNTTKNVNVSMRERGYETLREKKIIEKYP